MVGPDHQAFVAFLGQFDRQTQAFDHIRADGVHLGLDAGDQHIALVAIERPQTNGVIFMQRGAGGLELGRVGAQHVFRKILAFVNRQLAAGNEGLAGGAPGAFRRMHATGSGHRAVEHPVRQRRRTQRLAGVNVFLDPVRHFHPTGFLPQLERALAGTKPPAHRKVDVAGGFGNAGEMHRSVMKLVAQHGPQKARLGAFSMAQQPQALAGRLFQHAANHFIGFRAAGHVFHAFRVQPQDVAAHFFIETRAGFLAQAFGLQQAGQHRRRAIHLGKRVFNLAASDRAEVVLQRLDDVRHRVQPDHVGGAEGARTGAP